MTLQSHDFVCITVVFPSLFRSCWYMICCVFMQFPFLVIVVDRSHDLACFRVGLPSRLRSRWCAPWTVWLRNEYLQWFSLQKNRVLTASVDIISAGKRRSRSGLMTVRITWFFCMWQGVQLFEEGEISLLSAFSRLANADQSADIICLYNLLIQCCVPNSFNI